MNKIIYLDNNATTAVDPRVAEAVSDALLNLTGNPSSMHQLGRQSKQALMKARDTIAALLGVSNREILFTSGGTEGMNLLIQGLLSARPGLVITSNLEHSCVLDPIAKTSHATLLEGGEFGAVTPGAVSKAITPDTSLISLMAVNNETGVLTDIDGVAELALSQGIPFVVDGVALLGKGKVTIPSGVTAMAFSGHKFHAPKGVGFIYLKRGTKLNPLVHGGGQEFQKRSGTENLPGIIGLAKAVELAFEDGGTAEKRMAELRDKLENQLQQSISIQINGKGPRVSNTTNIAFSDRDAETLLAQLDQQGIAASHGSACSSGALEPSRVLLNMGYELKRARSSVRFSLSRFTTEEEIDHVVSAII